VTELNSTASDTYPMLVDPLTVYFSSERPSTHGQANIFRATRVSPDAGWGEAAAVDELNSDIWDAPTWMSLDGCRLYITSGRADPGHQLYVASRGN
jgi:hypothetical protein